MGHDDIDLFIVTERGRAWSVYAMMVVLARALGCREVLCANFLVDVDHLSVPDRGDLFTGHEMMSLLPIHGAEVLREVVASNPWVADILPNADPRDRLELWQRGDLERRVARLLEVGAGPVGTVLERASRTVFGARIKRKARRGNGDVVLKAGVLKLHTTDNRAGVVSRFKARLQEHGLWSDRLRARMPKRERR